MNIPRGLKTCEVRRRRCGGTASCRHSVNPHASCANASREPPPCGLPSSAATGEGAAALGSNRLDVRLPNLDRRMLVDARDLEASPDRSGRIDEHYRTIAVERPRQRHDRVHPGAVEEGKQSEIEMHVSLGSQVDASFQVDESFLEKGGCSEIELSVQAQASDASEGRNLEYRHGVSSFQDCGTIRDDS